MKRWFKKSKDKITKGTSSAVLLSILIHAGLFLLAGTLVIFTVVKKKEQKFEPPKAVERPKMKLKKPKVRVKKSSRPKSTTRIVTKVNRNAMPDIQLPEMSGMGDGLGDGFGEGFGMMPELEKVTIFGSGQSIGNDLEGTFYYFMKNRQGRPIPYSKEKYFEVQRKFLVSGWDPSVFSGYYKSPRKIYSTMFVVPSVFSTVAPQAFGEYDVEGQQWLVHYKGQIVYPEDITFRFVGQADSTIIVRLNGKIVFGSNWHQWEQVVLSGIWTSTSADDRKWWMGNYQANVGDWITMKANESYDVEILLGDTGGLACLMLAIQEQGVEYEIRPGGGPRLPAFKTAMPSRRLQDIVYRDMVPGEISLTNGPVFNDYAAMTKAPEKVKPTAAGGEFVTAAVAVSGVDEFDTGMRAWACNDGKSFEAEFVMTMGDKAIFKDERGKQKKVLLTTLTDEERDFIDLSNPPTLSVSASSKSTSVFAIENATKTEVIGYDCAYTGHIKQTSAGTYDHDLTVEFFAIGVQRFADKYILLNRHTSTFTLTEENKKSYSFIGTDYHLRRIEPRYWEKADFTVRGEKDYGYLLVVKDKRDQVVAYKSTANWLYENYEKLKDLPLNAYMDETATRVFPEGPPRALY